MRSASSTWSGARRKREARNLNKASYLPRPCHRRTGGSAWENSTRASHRGSDSNKCCSNRVLFCGLVVAMCLTSVHAASLARTLSVDSSLAASQGVLKVLSARRDRCEAAWSATCLWKSSAG